MAYKQSSPYSNTPIRGDYLDIMDPKFIVEDPGDESYEIIPKYDQRPDLLSHHKYGTVDYWWVFSARNPDLLIDPIQDFRAGTIIRIPKLKNIR
tara:strand:+ start:710 stop:991 length:282 start_codon:yes stop_codon:yes gene_type:complete